MLTVLTGALLIPIQLTEVEKARRQAAKATTNMNMDKAPYIPPFYKDLVPFDFDLEVSLKSAPVLNLIIYYVLFRKLII